MIWVILYAIYWRITTPGTLKERWIQGVTPVFDQKKSQNGGVNNENLPAEEENRLVNGEEETELEETSKNDNLA